MSSQRFNHWLRGEQAKNKTRKAQLGAGLLERKHVLAHSIDLSLRQFAPLRLSRLHNKHAIAGKANYYNGIAMWPKIAAMRHDPGMLEEATDHDRQVEAMRDESLPHGCLVDDYADQINCLVRDILYSWIDRFLVMPRKHPSY